MTVTHLVDRLLAYRLPTGREADFQLAVSDLLAREGLAFEREYDLGPGRGRIDFYLRALKVGLELKVNGSPSSVVAQLQRYLLSPELDALVLVTGRARLGALPSAINGKPVHVAAVWRGAL